MKGGKGGNGVGGKRREGKDQFKKIQVKILNYKKVCDTYPCEY